MPHPGDDYTWRRLHLATPTPGDAYTWRRLILATPHPGDDYTWGRLHLATPHLGDALSGQPVDFLPLGPLEGSQHTLTLTLTLTLVNAWGRDDLKLQSHLKSSVTVAVSNLVPSRFYKEPLFIEKLVQFSPIAFGRVAV